jgi:hypothetical protein
MRPQARKLHGITQMEFDNTGPCCMRSVESSEQLRCQGKVLNVWEHTLDATIPPMENPTTCALSQPISSYNGRSRVDLLMRTIETRGESHTLQVNDL